MARRKRLPHFSNAEVIDLDVKGRGLIKEDEKVAFVKGAVPGDRIDAQAFRKKKKVFEANLVNLLSPSEDRTQPFCRHFDECGGCKLQNIEYEAQLRHKHKILTDAIQRIGKFPYGEIQPILGCERTREYRNKLEYSFSNKRWITQAEVESGSELDAGQALGYHVPGRYDKILHIEECHLMDLSHNAIRTFVFDYMESHSLSAYDLKEHGGVFRNLLIRMNEKGEYLVMLVLGVDKTDIAIDCLEKLTDAFPAIVSAYYMINTKLNDSVYDLDPVHVKGSAYLVQAIANLSFYVEPKSFMQTNPFQTPYLYQLVEDFAGLKGHEVVYDLFCGVGTIGMFLAGKAQKVVGIETVPEAIEMAEKNKELNQLTNTDFVCGSVEKVLDASFWEQHGRADLIILDPPRMGLHPDVVHNLLELQAPKIVYVSCNPSTQARDLSLLSEIYTINKIRAVDMFPHTPHVESVAQLTLKSQHD